MAAFFYALPAGENSRVLNSAQIEVQSELRRAAEWIAKDVRQTARSVRPNIASSSNNPLSTHIKFNKVTGYDTAGAGAITLSPNYIEYTYDPVPLTITRFDSSTGGSWVFRNIVQAPFYTNNSGEIISISPLNPGEDSPVQQTGNLVLKLVGQKQTQGGINLTYALTEEVRIRN
jgi:hypothetical protein